jgi:hypothetical protein
LPVGLAKVNAIPWVPGFGIGLQAASIKAKKMNGQEKAPAKAGEETALPQRLLDPGLIVLVTLGIELLFLL